MITESHFAHMSVPSISGRSRSGILFLKSTPKKKDFCNGGEEQMSYQKETRVQGQREA
jgi:hypothetical protein